MNTDSPASPTSTLAAALCRAQVAVLAAEKTSTNTFHGYNYASAETIIVVGRDALNGAGLTLSLTAAAFEPFPAGANVGGAVGLLRSTFLLEHELGATRELTSDTPVCPEQGKTSGWSRPLDKALFGARTEALGYVLRDLLLIPRSDAPNVNGRTDAAGEAPPPGAPAPTRRRAAGAAAALAAPPVASAPIAAPAAVTPPPVASPVVGHALSISPDDFNDATADTIVEILAAHRAAGFGPAAEVEFTARVIALLGESLAPAQWGGIVASAKIVTPDLATQLRTAYSAAIQLARAAVPA